MQNALPLFSLVMLGIGHTNAHVLKMWRMQPLPNARLICVSNYPIATYSGMLPGTLAGQYEPAEMEIDLVRLCAAAGARLIQANVTGVDVANQNLQFADRPPIPFDALSIGVGSRPAKVPGDESRVLQIKPMQLFRQRLAERLQTLAHRSDTPIRIVVAGGGAGGFEIACCLPEYIRQHHPTVKAELTIVDRGHEILKSMPSRTRTLARRELDRQGIRVLHGQEITNVGSDGRLEFSDGGVLEADLILWSISARASKILDTIDLPKDPRGFLVTRKTLQSTAADSIFAVGDTGTLEHHRLAKAGVYAVRQGPILWENFQRRLARRPMLEWQPQKSFLTLLNTGDGRAIVTYKGISLHARWCWKLKDSIDRGFMQKYQDYKMAMHRSVAESPAETKMHCGGCGSKLGADTLSRVLDALDNPSSSRVLVGLGHADDVAVVKNLSDSHSTRHTAVTTDFFTAFLDDPFLVGQIAALNALSDLYASGSDPFAALAMVTVPYGLPKQQEQFLREILEGALQVFRPANVPIVGGHTIEGEQATIGFTVLGDIDEQQLATKASLQPGDQLVLTKSLGTGILLAAHKQALCQAAWMDAAVSSMLVSNRDASLAARDLGIRAITDITGFGLAGHLLEMLRASNVSAEISLASLPVLAGATELIQQGIESTLAADNRHAERLVKMANENLRSGDYAALFDPQTSGGLLLGVPERLIESLRQRLPDSVMVIGKIIEPKGDAGTIHVLP